MTVEQAKAALEKAREHQKQLRSQPQTIQTIHRPAAIGGSYTEQVRVATPGIEEANAAAREAERQLRLAFNGRHNTLARKLRPEIDALEERITGLQQELDEALQVKANLISNFTKECGCRRSPTQHQLFPAPSVNDLVATGGS